MIVMVLHETLEEKIFANIGTELGIVRIPGKVSRVSFLLQGK